MATNEGQRTFAGEYGTKDVSGPDAPRELLRFFLTQSLNRGRRHARA